MATPLSQICATALDKTVKELELADLVGAKGARREIFRKSIEPKSIPETAMDIVAETSVNGLLSGTGTPLINLISGVTQSLLMPTVRLAESLVLRDPKVAREALSMYSGAITGYADFIPFFKAGWSKGMPLDLDVTDYRRLGLTKEQYQKLLQAGGLGPDSSAADIRAFMGDAYDYVNKAIPGLTGEIIRIPSRLLVGIDEGMKAMLRRQKFNALAFQKALEDVPAGGEGLTQRFRELRRQKLIGEEGAAAWKSVKGRDDGSPVELSALYQAQGYAKMAVFQQELLGAAKQVQRFRSEVKPLMLFLPFFKTPYNILKEGLSFVPGLGYVTASKYRYAPQQPVGQKAFAMEKSEIAARQLLGFGAMATALTLHDQGLITGTYPSDPNRRQMMIDSGIPELSIRTPNGWVSFAKIEPMATVMGLMSDVSENIDNYIENSDNPTVDEFDELVSGSLWSLKQNILGKSFMEGLAAAINVLSLEEGNVGGFEDAIANIGRVVIPYGALLNNVARTMDSAEGFTQFGGTTYDRQATEWYEKIQQRIPVLRESLPLMYGIFGPNRTLNYWDIWTGVRTVDEVNRTDLQQELGALSIAYSPISKAFRDNMRLDNEELGRLRQLAAEVGTPILENLVASVPFQDAPESVKEILFKDAMRAVRAQAKQQFIYENMGKPNFQARFQNALRASKGLGDLLGFEEVPDK